MKEKKQAWSNPSVAKACLKNSVLPKYRYGFMISHVKSQCRHANGSGIPFYCYAQPKARLSCPAARCSHFPILLMERHSGIYDDTVNKATTGLTVQFRYSINVYKESSDIELVRFAFPSWLGKTSSLVECRALGLKDAWWMQLKIQKSITCNTSRTGKTCVTCIVFSEETEPHTERHHPLFYRLS